MLKLTSKTPFYGRAAAAVRRGFSGAYFAHFYPSAEELLSQYTAAILRDLTRSYAMVCDAERGSAMARNGLGNGGGARARARVRSPTRVELYSCKVTPEQLLRTNFAIGRRRGPMVASQPLACQWFALLHEMSRRRMKARVRLARVRWRGRLTVRGSRQPTMLCMSRRVRRCSRRCVREGRLQGGAPSTVVVGWSLMVGESAACCLRACAALLRVC